MVKRAVNYHKHYYSRTWLIQQALGEKFGVGIDRVSDYTVLNTEKMAKSSWKSMSDNTGKWITQVSDKTGLTVLVFSGYPFPHVCERDQWSTCACTCYNKVVLVLLTSWNSTFDHVVL